MDKIKEKLKTGLHLQKENDVERRRFLLPDLYKSDYQIYCFRGDFIGRFFNE